MIHDKKDTGYYCNICKTTYSIFGNISIHCLKGECIKPDKTILIGETK